MDIDWSTIVGSVVYTVQVHKLSENVPATDVVLEIDPSLTAFRLSEENNHQILVNECLVYVTYYNVVVKITNDNSCRPGTLSLTTTLATPVYNMSTTELTATPNEYRFVHLTYAFTIAILNDAVSGGCAAFSCTALCLNDQGQNFKVDTKTHLVKAQKSTLVLGFTYDLKVPCLDDIKNTFVTPGHSLYINITFYREMTSPEQTTLTTIISMSEQTRTPEQTTPITTPGHLNASEPTMPSTTHIPTKRTHDLTTITRPASKPDLTTTLIQTTRSMPTMQTKATTTRGQTTSIPAKSTIYTSTSASTLQSTITATVSAASKATSQTGKTKSLPPSSAATEIILTQVVTTGGGTTCSVGNTGFFSKSENIVTVLLPASAFCFAAFLGLGYIMRNKFKKSVVDPVLVQ